MDVVIYYKNWVWVVSTSFPGLFPSQKIVSLRVKTLSNTNLVVPRHVKTREKGSLSVDMHLLKLSIIPECVDCEWHSNYGNHRSAIFFFRLVSRTQGRDFEIKIKRKSGEVHPERFDNWV